MHRQTVTIMSRREEECVRILMKLGIRKTITFVLVYLANVGEATSRDIERGTELGQPDVNTGTQILLEKNWIVARKSTGKKIGRPYLVYAMAIPFNDIIRDIETEKRREADHTICLAKKLQHFVPA
jgi:predicted transcriptional regulator